MKIEIKRLKVNHRLSEETLNFSADIYVDGKKVGWAGNHGTGGETDIGGMSKDMHERLTAYAEATYTEAMGAVRWSQGEHKGKLVDGLGQYIDHLVHEEDKRRTDEKERKRTAKIDAEQKAEFAAQGMGTLRWTMVTARQTTTRWFGIPKGRTPEEVAAYATKKYGHKDARLNPVITWEVI